MPPTGRLSEALATHHEQRADHARGLSRHWSAETGVARNAAVTDATALIERYNHDVSVGEAHARGVTESESAQVQALESDIDKLAETGGITRSQAAILTGEGAPSAALLAVAEQAQGHDPHMFHETYGF